MCCNISEHVRSREIVQESNIQGNDDAVLAVLLLKIGEVLCVNIWRLRILVVWGPRYVRT